MNDAMLKIKAAIFEMSLLFNQQPSDERITAYAKALQNYTPKQITHAFNQVILSGSAFFPSLAEILKHLRPTELLSEDIGNFVANEIIQKCIRWGEYQLKECFEDLSDASKKVIGSNTYLLKEIAISEKSQLPTLRAQIRGLAKAASEAHKAGLTNDKLEKLGIKDNNVFSISSRKMISLDFSDFKINE